MNGNKEYPMLFSKTNEKNEDLQLLEPYNYGLQALKQGSLEKLLESFNHWLKVDETSFHQIKKIIQVLHRASLLVDDIEDDSELRGEMPVPHKIFGLPSTINAANYAMFIALEEIQALNKPEALQVFTEEMLELHRGQGMEIYWRDNHICPTKAEYENMAIRKTGGLFKMAVRLMQLFSEHASKYDFTNLINLFGFFHQVQNDYSNLKSEKYAKTKGFAEDLTEGKFSFPIIHAIGARANDRQVLQLLKLRTSEEPVKKYCIGLLEKAGSFQHTQDCMEELKSKILKEIHNLGENLQFEKIVKNLAQKQAQKVE